MWPQFTTETDIQGGETNFMSAILFHKTSVYQEMADAFADSKDLLRYRSWDDARFYKALRRLYFTMSQRPCASAMMTRRSLSSGAWSH
jgi:hypothetical protein